MLRALSCATTVFIATAFVSAQEVQSTVGPLERTATAASPENPIPRRLSAPPAARVNWQGATGRGLLRLQVTLDTTGSIAEIRTVTAPLVQFAAGTTIGDDVRRAIAAAILESAAAAVSQWKYDLPPVPITFPVQFLFPSAADPVATQNPPPPVPVPLSSALPPPQIEDWPAAAGIPRVGGAIRPPTQTKKVNPVYPLAAQLERVQGVVILEVIVGVDGKVSDMRVLRSAPFLDDAAIDAVRQWEYTPAQLDGKPTPVVMTVTTTFNMDVGTPSGPLTVAPWPAAAGAVRVGGSIAPPRRTKDARPDFPDEAQRRRTGGAVLLEVLIGPDGKVRDVRVIRSSPLFDKAAMDSARKWEYTPTEIDGTAVPVVMTVTVTFSLR